MKEEFAEVIAPVAAGRPMNDTDQPVPGVDVPAVQWHPGFCSTFRLEMKHCKNALHYQQEYNLTRKPLQIDLLVTKESDDSVIHNELGKLFRKYNIVEYKSPDDSLSVDTYFKTLGNACLFKSNGERGVDSIHVEDVTISLIRKAKPHKFFRWLRNHNYVIEEKYPGVYYVKRNVVFATQVIVIRELDPGKHLWLTSLTRKLEVKTARTLVEAANQLTDSDDRIHADAMLSVVMDANPEIFERLKKAGGTMCEALLRLMAPEVEEIKQKAVAEAVKKNTESTTISLLVQLVQQELLTAEQAAKQLGVPVASFEKELHAAAAE
ncbi:MAG: hypothetical protein IJ468_03545 [Lachnospiraceae bacterium]|nr:hypothetical protein [Lachnospiraceae bacterium]